jgi:hypothetical protein
MRPADPDAVESQLLAAPEQSRAVVREICRE